MTEQVSINGKKVWLVVTPVPVHRKNPHTIPTEYFTVSYYLSDPASSSGELIEEDNGSPKLFESPVAALQYANEKLSRDQQKIL